VDGIAQVDLGRRAHRHQALRDLGAMATQVMSAAWSRATKAEPAESVLLRQYSSSDEGMGEQDRQVALTERPPARTVAAR
jgi:glucosyl-3-phosphoglycerate synthase